MKARIFHGPGNVQVEEVERWAILLLTTVPRVAQLNAQRFKIDDAPKAYSSRLGMDGLKSLVVF